MEFKNVFKTLDALNYTVINGSDVKIKSTKENQWHGLDNLEEYIP